MKQKFLHNLPRAHNLVQVHGIREKLVLHPLSHWQENLLTSHSVGFKWHHPGIR